MSAFDIQSPTLKKRLAEEFTEQQAEAVLRILAPQLIAWAEYENAINWHTDCLNCARVLDSAYQETCRAEKAEKELEAYEENVVGDMNEKAIDAARKIAELQRLYDEARAVIDELRSDIASRDEADDKQLGEAIDVMRRFKEAYEQSEKQRQNALAEREEWRRRALARRAAIHEIRAELKKTRAQAAEAESETAARILHQAADRMEGARMDPDAINFLHLLAERQTEGFFTDIPHPKDKT